MRSRMRRACWAVDRSLLISPGWDNASRMAIGELAKVMRRTFRGDRQGFHEVPAMASPRGRGRGENTSEADLAFFFIRR